MTRAFDMLDLSYGPVDQPEQEVFYVDDLFMRRITCRQSNIMVPQHSHEYDHWTYLRKGIIGLYIEGQYICNHIAPSMILIEARRKHAFLTRSDLVVLQCIHDVEGSDDKEPRILEEHILKVT